MTSMADFRKPVLSLTVALMFVAAFTLLSPVRSLAAEAADVVEALVGYGVDQSTAESLVDEVMASGGNADELLEKLAHEAGDDGDAGEIVEEVEDYLEDLQEDEAADDDADEDLDEEGDEDADDDMDEEGDDDADDDMDDDDDVDEVYSEEGDGGDEGGEDEGGEDEGGEDEGGEEEGGEDEGGGGDDD